jgi:hypothetical protein
MTITRHAAIVLGSAFLVLTSSCSSGGPGAMPASVSINVSGARSDDLSFDGSVDNIRCHAFSGTLGITAHHGTSFSGPGLDMYIDAYDGPATYDRTYSHGVGANDTSITLDLAGGYEYWYFYDYSRVSFAEVDARCTVEITGTASHIDGLFECTSFPANISSPDYEDMPASYEPSVGFSGDFHCDVTTT